MNDELKGSLYSVHRSAFSVHRFFERVDLCEVARLVSADEGEPLVEVDRPPGGVREARGVAVNALDARAQGVERGAGVAQRGERVGERRARWTDVLRRGEFLRAGLLDEFGDGDGGERPGGGARLSRGLGLLDERAEELRHAPLDYREVFQNLRDRPLPRRGSEVLPLGAQALDRLKQTRARVVYVVEDFRDAVVGHPGFAPLCR